MAEIEPSKPPDETIPTSSSLNATKRKSISRKEFTELGVALPIPRAKVRRIIKNVPDTNKITSESVVTIIKATQMFLESLAIQAKKQTDKDDRKSLRTQDILEAILENKAQLGFLSDAFGPVLSNEEKM